jgi:sugar phosphate isomerase/epimerase
MKPVTIAFNTANLVGHFTNYKFELGKWGDQHKLASEKIDPASFAEICQKIRSCGYSAIELWVALVEKCDGQPARGQEFLRIMHDASLCPVMFGGTLNDFTARLCKMFGIGATAGGYWGSDKATAARVMRETGILFNFENHPEKSAEEMRQQIDYGANGMAIALDTGWCGTSKIDGPKLVRDLGRLIRHVHLKDVSAVGGHATCKLGTGVVDIPGVIRELKLIGYEGILSWEDEPENRNPFDIAAEMREYIDREWRK